MADGSESTDGGGEGRAPERARFVDRFVAFAIDYLLVLACAYSALYAAGRVLGPAAAMSPALLIAWLAGWLLAFIGYHGVMASGGRRSVGKRLVGIQVTGQDGYPIPLKTAILRALSYLISSLLFGLGFLWALVSSKRLCWHDMLTGTMVLETRPKGGLARAGVWAAALALGAVNLTIALWPAAAPRYYDMQRRALAQQNLRVLAAFEARHKAATGTYTADFDALGRIYGNPEEFLLLVGQSLDLRSLRITADRDRFLISAAALDEAGTMYEVSGPP